MKQTESSTKAKTIEERLLFPVKKEPLFYKSPQFLQGVLSQPFHKEALMGLTVFGLFRCQNIIELYSFVSFPIHRVRFCLGYFRLI